MEHCFAAWLVSNADIVAAAPYAAAPPGAERSEGLMTEWHGDARD
jgi:hypothetical protein